MECIAVRRGRDIMIHRATCHHARRAWYASTSQNDVYLCDDTELGDPMAVACRVCKPGTP